jgi:hypothetical protein
VAIAFEEVGLWAIAEGTAPWAIASAIAIALIESGVYARTKLAQAYHKKPNVSHSQGIVLQLICLEFLHLLLINH